ncbi:uncharacterized protein ARMOST_19848 [Armillaria ostoyae]|uniref:Uncharacterized protein n=1 Tax=Armillaria ostoyae TaxID=47428 RepID=A0A284S5Q6_ARMOS|nr:uncharacterized protein ARMOST_19848 [Armillaria ostoyae]
MKHTRTFSNPFTPVRKLFLRLDLFKSSSVALEEYDTSEHDPVVDTPPAQSEIRHPHTLSTPGSIALQNEDACEDAIVITTLDTVPFCCHEDLLTMSRSQLVQVATTLNARLPAVLRIDTSLNRSDSFIRNSIEVIVGLRRDVPPAPKAVRMRSGELRIEDDGGISGNCSPPTSPLARLSARGTPRLTRLEEEDEEENDRPSKRRRVTCGPTTPTPLPRALRSYSQHVSRASPTPNRVVRSHSQKLQERMDNMQIDTRFVTITRPRYGKRRAARLSTPTKFQRESISAMTPIHRSTPTTLGNRFGRIENGGLTTDRNQRLDTLGDDEDLDSDVVMES